MGYTISGILIDKLPGEAGIPDSPVETKFRVEPRTSLCPGKLTIGFRNSSTFIFLDNIFYRNMNEEEALSQLEANVNSIFPNAGFLTIAINETSDIKGYSFIDKGKKIRTKVVMQGRIFLDYGELNPLELRLCREMQEYLADKPEVRGKLAEHTKSMTDLEAAKFLLIYRDKLYDRNKVANPYQYLGGSLDTFVVGKLLQGIAKCDFPDIENTPAVVFDKKKLNFTRDSLAPFIRLAFTALRPGNN